MGVLSRGRRAPWLLEAQLHAAPGPADLSVGAWLRARGVAGAEGRAAEEWFRQNWAAEPDLLSARGIADAHLGDSVGDGEFAVAGGFDVLPAVLAEGLDIRLGCPVLSLWHTPGRVRASTIDGTVHAAAAVVTVPPTVVGSGRLLIEDLPPDRLDAAKRLPLGDGCCAVVTLDRVAPETVVTLDADGSGGFLRSAAGRPELLIVAKSGAAAALRAALGPGGRDALSALLKSAAPWSAGARITGIETADWGSDPYAGGAFTAPSVGAEDAAATWAEPLDGTLFFAGEATVCGSALPWVHGALASGERAADQLLEAMSR
jgi:monoamine oxidase